MESIQNCPVCGAYQFEDYLQCIDYTVSRETFTIQSCQSCGFLFTNPRPAESEMGRYYKAEAYISHTDSSKGLINKIYKQVRSITLNQKFSLIKPFLTNNRLLDVGAGTGAFLDFCKTKGVDVSGVEPDEDARGVAKLNYDLKLDAESAMGTFQDEQFSVITLWHVLEHVANLNERIIELKRVLSRDGRIFIAVPNHTSHDARHYRKHWAAYDVPRHLYHFDEDTIRQLFRKHGLELEKTLPMKFDSTYVSLLSEKYKTGRTNFLSGVFHGVFSNLTAKPNTWSSQIYVFKK